MSDYFFLITGPPRQPARGREVRVLTIGQQSASLRAEGDVFDQISGSSKRVTIDIVWSKNGTCTQQSQVSHFKSLPSVGVSRSTQTVCPAVASGTIVIDGINLTPEVTNNADFVLYTQKNVGVQ